MNHIYRSLWSAALNTWIAVVETSKSKTNNHNSRRKLFVAGLLACSPCAWALPTGEQLVAGQATVKTPIPGQMQINQATSQAIINWQGFSIKPQEIVKIQQPTINSTLLNRVVGTDASVIQSQLSANGQVFLINPNGVLFSPSAQVEVGGLIASTHSISNADFLKGNYHFTQSNSEGIVTNQGLIRIPAGGMVALIGTQVTNEGSISTPKGTTVLAASKTVDLDFQGDGLVEVKIPQAALDAQVANKGAILADGGRVILTAQAANELLNTAVNQSGVIQARSLVERNGEIILAGGDSGTTLVSGTLDTSGQTGGGKISVTGKNVNIQSVANLTAQALESGKAGNISIFGNMKNGQVNVAGKLDASAPKKGDGGFIETSAAQVNIADSAKITTKAEQGKSGTWLIDPTDITVAATGGNITGSALGTALSAGNVTLDTSAGCTGATCTALTGTNGDIFVNDPVNWSANLLTLKADRNIAINANLTAASAGSLSLTSLGVVSASNAVSVDGIFTLNLGTWKQITSSLPSFFAKDFRISGTTFIRALSGDGSSASPYQIADVYGLQGMKGNLAGNYALGADIDASATAGWNAGVGFKQIGDAVIPFTGQFDGLGHTISNLLININNYNYDIGLFGTIGNTGVVKNIGVVNASLGEIQSYAAYDNIGGILAGHNYGTIENAYATGTVSILTNTPGSNNIAGGLVGDNVGTINKTYAAVNITNRSTNYSYSGGLVGVNEGTIRNSYATGSVDGDFVNGGLSGFGKTGTIINSYATGHVSGLGSSNLVGGLIGPYWVSMPAGTVTNSFWDINTTGQTTSFGGTGLTTAQMQTASTFSVWGADISTTGGSSAAWRIYDGNTYPLLRGFLTPLTVTADALTKTYNGLSDSVLSNPTYSVTPNANLLGLSSPYGTAKDVGTYTATGLYSNQQGFDITQNSGVLTITPYILDLTGTRSYDGTTAITASTVTLGALPNNETLTLTGSGSITDKNVGNNKPLSTLFGIANGTGLVSNYTFTGGTQKVNITPATLTINAVTDTKTYDGTTTSTRIPTFNGLKTGDTLSGLSQAFTSKNVLGTNASTLAVNSGYTLADGHAGGNYTVITNTAAGTITPANIAVNLTGTRVYDGTTAVAASIFSLSGLLTGDDLTLNGAGNVASKNVGTYNALNLGTLALGNGVVGLANNYTLNGGTDKVTITPANVTFTVQNVTKDYDGTTQASPSASVTSGTLFLSDSITYGSFAFTDKNAGTGKTVVANDLTVNDGNGGNNYAITTVNSTNSTINKANITVSGNDVTKVYDGTTVATTTPTVVSGKLFGADTLSGGTFTFADKNVGTGKTVTASDVAVTDGNGGNNYAVSYIANPRNTITKAAVQLSTENVSKTYDGTTTAQGKPVVVSGKFFENNTLSGGVFTFADKNAGTNKTVTVKNVSISDSNSGGNYDVTYVDNTGSTITPAPITLSAQVAGKVYDGTLTAQGTATVSSGKLFSGDTLSAAGFSFKDKNVGTNKTIIINGLAINDGNGGNNYQITSQPATASITPANLKITANDVTKTYDGTTVAVGTAKVASGILFAGDLLSGGQFAFADKNVGTNKTVTVSGVKVDDGNGGNNYLVNYSNNINSLINKANLTFTATDVTKIYDGTTQANSSAVVANGNLFGADSFSGGSFAFADKNAGTNKTVKIAQVLVNDGNNGNNYAVNYQDNTHSTITPAALTLNATSDSKVYDGTTASSGAVTFSGLVSGDTLGGLRQSFVSKNVLGANQSTLAVNSDYALNDGNAGQNYNVTTHTATGTITPANLTLTTNDVVKTYDGTIQASGLAVVANGNLLGGDSLSGGSFAFLDKNAGAGKTVTVSNVAINDGNGGNNYAVNYINNINSLINKAALTLTSTDVTKTYDGTTRASGSVVVANGNLLGGDSLSGGVFAFADKHAGAKKTVTLNDVTINDGNGGNNYFVNYSNNINSLIKPAGLTLTTTDVSKIYDDTTSAKGTAVVANGILFVDDALSGGIFAFTDKNVGTNKTVTVSDVQIKDGNGGKNYAVRYADNTHSTIRRDESLTTAIASTVTNLQTTTIQTARASSTAVASRLALNAPESASATRSDAIAIDFAGGDTVTSSASEAVILKTSFNINSLRNIDILNEPTQLIKPILTIKNSAGRVRDVELSANREYISLLLEDGTIRVWDLLRGVQRRIEAQTPKNKTTNIGRVDEKGDVLAVASQSGIHTYDVISSSTEGAIAESNVSEFANSNDATRLLSTVAGGNRLSLWNNKQLKKQWDRTYQRGVVKNLALSDDKRYAAVLSQVRGGVYAFTPNLQLHHLTDAVDILDMTTGKTLQSLPGFGEQIVSIQFNDNETLQIGQANGQIVEWSLATKSAKTVVHFAKAILAIDKVEQKYAYILTDGSVQVADNKGIVELSIENKENPFQHAKLLENGKKLLTVMASGDLAIWDVASGKKMLRLFSTKQGWTVMDAFGRFDGSEEAMENFVWLAEAEGLSIDNFSENYYEPGLLANVLKNEDYFKGDASAIDKGITLPPKVALQLADKQTTGDSVTLQLDVYDRGGGISNVKFYQNGRLISGDDLVTAEQKLTENGAEHRVLTLKITPTPGENSFKVVASNEMNIENSSPLLTFDGKSKAYNAALKVLTIGINRYKEPELELNYSVADANLMSDVLKKHAKIAVSKSLLDENATKVKILAALKELSQGTQQDSLVIYLAGHGVALKKEWYFLPYETQLLPTLKEIVANGISASELSDIFKNSKIQHILLITDSCHSGGSMDVFTQLENSQRFFSRQLSRSLGITVITAAAKDQEAKELKNLGHGLFTYLMGEALQKNTPSEPVTAHSVAKSILQTLPAFSKKKIGSAQEPVAYMHGSDFILTGSLKK